MKINRLNPEYKRHHKTAPTEKRRKKYISDAQIANYTDFTNELNKIGNFTYLDYNRNLGAIQFFKSQINQLISNYGCDLQYFRRYNTFFKDEDENNSNLIYGEDTTAEFYASGMVRSFVSIENMAWNFNQLGLENVEQINIIISIDNFSQIFSKDIAKTETKYFEVEISGNTINNEGVGKIITDEFNADVYVNFSDNLIVDHSLIKMKPKVVNNLFYKSREYDTSLYQISGDLIGRLQFDDCYPNKVSGIIKGELTYHNYENIEDAETWKLAPQVGDYFKFSIDTGINEEWEITQVYDRMLTNKSGINPLLGKYIYQCAAVKRVESHEKTSFELDARQPGDDINEIFNQSKKKQKTFADQYLVKNGKNKNNEKTNKVAKNIYDYTDETDNTYGGYQNKPNAD